MKEVLVRSQFNRSMDTKLVDKLGLKTKYKNALKSYIKTGIVPKGFFEVKYNEESVEGFPEFYNILTDKKTTKVVRLLSYALEKADIKYISEREKEDGSVEEVIMNLNDFFSACIAFDAESIVDILLDNKDLLRFIDKLDITFKQSKTKAQYVSNIAQKRVEVKNTKTKKVSFEILTEGLVLIDKGLSLSKEEKKYLMIVSLVDACNKVSLGDIIMIDELVKLLDKNTESDFLDDEAYTNLALWSLQRGVSINDMYADLEVEVIDYEEMYNSLGKIILRGKNNSYKYEDEEGNVITVKAKDILNHI